MERKKLEEPDKPYDDGARTLYLYTKGTQGNPPEELCQFLHYMEDTRTENATTEALQKIDRMVKLVKADGEVSLEYMKIFEREELLVEEGFRQGQEMERQNTERERQRAEQERQNTEWERQRADQERQKAEQERQRADAAERELEQLKKKLGLM